VTGGYIAVFPDAATGWNAMSVLLHSRGYFNLSIDAVVARYAPPPKNPTAVYQANVQHWTGLSGTTLLNSLNVSEFEIFMNAMAQQEGFFHSGYITYYGAGYRI
jgi:hypothetical protein